MVVLGAGASYDCFSVRHVNPPAPNDSMPLTADLVAPLHATHITKSMPETASAVVRLQSDLARRVRNAEDQEVAESLEEVLGRWQREAEDDHSDMSARQLVAIRWFIQRRIQDVQDNLIDRLTASNYVELAERIERWRERRGERVAYVTFNYDTMLDIALETVLGRAFREDEDLTSGNTVLLRPHGSIRWWHEYDPGPDVEYEERGLGEPSYARKLSLQAAASLVLAPERWRRSFAPRQLNLPRFPALAVPMTDKLAFECPDRQIEALKRSVRSVDRLLLVGWRGQETHFRERLAGLKLRALEVVTQHPGTAEALAESLMEDGTISSVGQVHSHSGGFTAYVESADWAVLAQ